MDSVFVTNDVSVTLVLGQAFLTLGLPVLIVHVTLGLWYLVDSRKMNLGKSSYFRHLTMYFDKFGVK